MYVLVMLCLLETDCLKWVPSPRKTQEQAERASEWIAWLEGQRWLGYDDGLEAMLAEANWLAQYYRLASRCHVRPMTYQDRLAANLELLGHVSVGQRYGWTHHMVPVELTNKPPR